MRDESEPGSGPVDKRAKEVVKFLLAALSELSGCHNSNADERFHLCFASACFGAFQDKKVCIEIGLFPWSNEK